MTFNPDLSDSMGIDHRHWKMLMELTVACRAQRVLEIGSWRGCSTSAFVSLLQSGDITQLDVCDIQIQPEVRQMCQGTCARLHERESLGLLQDWSGPWPDLVFVDGDHRTDCVRAELDLLQNGRIPSLIAHDTGYLTTDEYGPNARLYKARLQAHPHWLVLEDNFWRKGERTNRGLLFATTQLGALVAAKSVFAKYTQEKDGTWL
jgi:predicted O-methyltransferase YrrM